MPEKIVPFNTELESLIGQEFKGETITPEFMNMLRAGKAAYEHGYHGFISREKFLEWVGKMYDGGGEQKKILLGEVHGKIIINKCH